MGNKEQHKRHYFSKLKQKENKIKLTWDLSWLLLWGWGTEINNHEKKAGSIQRRLLS